MVAASNSSSRLSRWIASSLSSQLPSVAWTSSPVWSIWVVDGSQETFSCEQGEARFPAGAVEVREAEIERPDGVGPAEGEVDVPLLVRRLVDRSIGVDGQSRAQAPLASREGAFAEAGQHRRTRRCHAAG